MSGTGERRSYLVECYWPGVGERKLGEALRRMRAAMADVRRQGRQVDLVGTILVPTDETVFCVFDGLEEDVRSVSTQAGVPFERVLESVRIDGEAGGADGVAAWKGAGPGPR
jgi:hypothetical protein